MNILVSIPQDDRRRKYFPEEAFEELRKLGNVYLNDSDRHFSEEEFAERIKGMDVCITHWGSPKFTGKALRNADRLKMVAHAAGSVGWLVTDEVYDRGIKVCSSNRIMAKSVSEGVLGYMLAGLLRIPQYDRAMRNGELWPHFDDAQSLFNKKVGLIGLGTVGRFLLELLVPFHVQVKVYDPYIKKESLSSYRNVELCPTVEEVLEWGDVISLHASKTPETYHMISKDRLALIRDGALLVNTSRGANIDEQALVEELKKNRFHAIVDVYEKEPLKLTSELRQMGNVTAMPHVAGVSGTELAYGMVDEIRRFCNNEPLQLEIPREAWRLMTIE
jgi:phosphoglycerate dehydrogenase-like enzyme